MRELTDNEVESVHGGAVDDRSPTCPYAGCPDRDVVIIFDQ